MFYVILKQFGRWYVLLEGPVVHSLRTFVPADLFRLMEFDEKTAEIQVRKAREKGWEEVKAVTSEELERMRIEYEITK